MGWVIHDSPRMLRFLRADLGLAGSNSEFGELGEYKATQLPEGFCWPPSPLGPSQREDS